MMTAMAQVERPLPWQRRAFAALVITVVVIAGFVPVYTIRLLHHDPNLTWLVHLHGLTMASWIALLLTQTLLVAKHRVDLHRKLGLVGALLIPAILAIGFGVLLNAATRQTHSIYDSRFYWMLVAFDGANLLLFAGLAASAIMLRRRSDYHKRLMLLATLSLLGPAFGRLTSIASGFREDSDLTVLLLMLSSVLICAGVDTRRHRRWHPVFLWGTALVVAADWLTYLAKTRL